MTKLNLQFSEKDLGLAFGYIAHHIIAFKTCQLMENQPSMISMKELPGVPAREGVQHL